MTSNSKKVKEKKFPLVSLIILVFFCIGSLAILSSDIPEGFKTVTTEEATCETFITDNVTSSACYYDLPCKRYNIEGKDCVREGHTGRGFLGMRDLDTIYYSCMDYGRIPLRCEEYYQSFEEFKEDMGG